MSAEPVPGTEAVLRAQTGEAHRARIVAVMSGRVSFELSDTQDDRTFAWNERLLITWPDDTGLTCLPVVVVEQPDEDDTIWLSQIVAEAWHEQRRRHVRKAVEGTVSLRRLYAEAIDAAFASLIDLSEAGLRCALDERYLDLGEPGTLVALTLELPDDQFDLTGTVLYARYAAREDRRVECVVVFDRPVAHLERLRRHIGDEGSDQAGAPTGLGASPVSPADSN
jgi:hypothetical protein